MTLAEASQAAGEPIIEVGDGAAYATGDNGEYFKGPAFVNVGDPSGTARCVGASGTDSGTDHSDRRRLKLGDSVDQLKKIYGSRLIYMPDPQHGMAPKVSYVVEEADGYLAFWLNPNGVFAVVGNPGGFDQTNAYVGSNACIA